MAQKALQPKTPEQIKEAKIAQLKRLRDAYFKMEGDKDVSKEEKLHIRMHAMELQIRQDRLQRQVG